MLEFYFLSNDGQVDLVKSFSRENAYQILFELSEFEDLIKTELEIIIFDLMWKKLELLNKTLNP